MRIYSTSATYYSISAIFCTKWILSTMWILSTKWIISRTSWINLHEVNILGFFSNLPLIEFCTKWIHIMQGPSVCQLAGAFNRDVLLNKTWWMFKTLRYLKTPQPILSYHKVYQNSAELRRILQPNCSYGDHHHHNTPMHYAAKHGMKHLIRAFLNDLGGNPNM